MTSRFAERGLTKLRTHHGLRLRWLALMPLLLLMEGFVVYMRIHDVIMAVSLHFDIKVEWIRNLNKKCVNNSQALAAQVYDKPGRNFCPELPDGLIGETHLRDWNTDVDLTQLTRRYRHVDPGGASRPPSCVARTKLAIIVPYRGRERHLGQLLKTIHPLLRRQQADYRIFVVQQAGDGIFNKAMLLNIGYLEALKQDPDIDCFIFHDVDLLPEDDRNLYRCGAAPRHMSVRTEKFGYRLPYEALFGGVIAMTKQHFAQVNGYSNEYWGWGMEDDDMYVRIVHSCLGLERATHQHARYRMVYHQPDNGANPNRFTLLLGATQRQHVDGLNSLRYRKLSQHAHPLYTNVTVDVGVPAPDRRELPSFGTMFDITISISLLLLMVFATCFTCFKSHLPHVISRRVFRAR